MVLSTKPRYDKQGLRRCTACDKYKDVAWFYRANRGNSGDGLAYYCIECSNSKNSAFRARRKEAAENWLLKLQAQERTKIAEALGVNRDGLPGALITFARLLKKAGVR